MQYHLTSTCDDAGNMLAKRIEQPRFVRTISSHATQAEAEAEKAYWLAWYAKRGVPIGEGCLGIHRR